MYTFIEMYNYMMKTKVITIAEIYSAYSCGAMIALSCDMVELQEFSLMMFHDISSYTMGKMGEIETHTEFMKKWGKEIIQKIYSGILTEKEIGSIKSGKDVWLVSSGIKKRLKKWKPTRGKEKK